MDQIRRWLACVALTCLSGCNLATRNTLTGQTVGDVVTNIVKFAQAGSTAPFMPMFEPHDDLSALKLLGMIQRSGMLTNYASRIESCPEGRARLDYHYLERGCFFQVDLQRDGDRWRVTRIFLCR